MSMEEQTELNTGSTDETIPAKAGGEGEAAQKVRRPRGRPRKSAKAAAAAKAADEPPQEALAAPLPAAAAQQEPAVPQENAAEEADK